MNNKRKNKRISCLVPVDGKTGSVFEETKTIDFSKGGMGFISHQRIPLHKKIAIAIELSENEEPVVVIGTVQWVRPISQSDCFRCGLSFEEIVSGSKTRLSRYFQTVSEASL